MFGKSIILATTIPPQGLGISDESRSYLDENLLIHKETVIFALKDDSNPGAMGKTGAGPMFPLACKNMKLSRRLSLALTICTPVFFLIFGLGACFGYETGYAINLARDFGPRLMSYAVGLVCFLSRSFIMSFQYAKRLALIVFTILACLGLLPPPPRAMLIETAHIVTAMKSGQPVG